MPGPPEPLTTVFVYGTLMPGERNEAVARRGGAFQAVPAKLRGFRLIHLHPEAYPGILPDPAGRVQGHALTYAPEAWAAALPFLDELEGTGETPPLYTRERVTLEVEGRPQPAWVYVYARTDRLTQPGVTPLPGGDWRAAPGRDRPQEGDR